MAFLEQDFGLTMPSNISDLGFDPIFDMTDHSTPQMSSGARRVDHTKDDQISRPSERPNAADHDLTFLHNTVSTMAPDNAHVKGDTMTARPVQRPQADAVSSSLRNSNLRPAETTGCYNRDFNHRVHLSGETINMVDVMSTVSMGGIGDIAISDMSNEWQCDCYPSVLLKLLDLEKRDLDTAHIPVDLVMKLEKDVQVQTTKILDCESCSQGRPSLFLLIGVIVENFISLLEKSSVVNTRPQDHVALERGLQTRPLPHGPDLQTGDSALSPVDNCSLRVGNYEIDGAEKAYFFKLFIQARLKELAATLRRLHDLMQRDRPNLYCKVGTTMMAEIHRRLLFVINRLVE